MRLAVTGLAKRMSGPREMDEAVELRGKWMVESNRWMAERRRKVVGDEGNEAGRCRAAQGRASRGKTAGGGGRKSRMERDWKCGRPSHRCEQGAETPARPSCALWPITRRPRPASWMSQCGAGGRRGQLVCVIDVAATLALSSGAASAASSACPALPCPAPVSCSASTRPR